MSQQQEIFCGFCNIFDLAKRITVIEFILSSITFLILIILHPTISWLYVITIMDLTLLSMEFFGIHLKIIRLIIASFIVRTTWTTFFGFIGITLMIQENHQMFGWENSYLHFGIILFLLFVYGIFRCSIQFKVFITQKRIEEEFIQSSLGSTTTTIIMYVSNPDLDLPQHSQSELKFKKKTFSWGKKKKSFFDFFKSSTKKKKI